MKTLALLFFKFLVWIAYSAYRIEGINALFLIMPAKLIIPTLRKYGALIGENTVLHSPLIIHNAGKDYRNLQIGSHCYGGREVFFDLKDKIEIGDRVTLSMRTMLITHTDAGESAVSRALPPSQALIRIENDAYLGAGVTVLQGVIIGKSAVVGAGSLVRQNVKWGMIVAGNPAREIRPL